MTDPDAERAQIRAAIDAIAQAYADAVAKIEAMSVAQAGFESANEVAALLDTLEGKIAAVRSRMVERISVEEDLTLTVLGRRIGVSKARAGQIIQQARRSREGS